MADVQVGAGVRGESVASLAGGEMEDGMHVRWQRRHRSSGQILITATLPQCERINGRPTPKYITYVASIRENDVASVDRRGRFWRSVTQRLDQLDPQLSRAARQRIEKFLGRMVRKPSAREVRALVREREEWERYIDLRDREDFLRAAAELNGQFVTPYG